MLSLRVILATVLATVAINAQVIPTAPNPKDKGAPPEEFDAFVQSVTDSTWFETERDGQHVSIKIYGILGPDRKTVMGLKASQEIGKLIYGQTVRVKRVAYSAYGGIVANVRLLDKDKTDLATFLLKHGYVVARAYLDLPDINNRYKELELQARADGVGIWYHPPAANTAKTK